MLTESNTTVQAPTLAEAQKPTEMEQLWIVIERLNRRVQLAEDALALEQRINAATRGRINEMDLAS